MPGTPQQEMFGITALFSRWTNCSVSKAACYSVSKMDAHTLLSVSIKPKRRNLKTKLPFWASATLVKGGSEGTLVLSPAFPTGREDVKYFSTKLPFWLSATLVLIMLRHLSSKLVP